ncbi:unnamed protein product [Prunus armeniaca]|uniref:Retrotransposon gag domain-containing protein n=1 Tax=Prunus armeniaca TaxID=36596 RepID=A0A6J5XDQ2_PRUAR|nr:unnamed protein product [Prunus armeniaca]
MRRTHGLHLTSSVGILLSLRTKAASLHLSEHQYERNQIMLRNWHLRKETPSGTTRRNAQRRRKKRLRSDRLKGLEEKMSRILKGVKDVQNLSNSLRAQNEILQENQAELAGQVHAQRELELTSTKSTGGASSLSTVVGAPGRNVTDARNILKEKKAWREHNKRLVMSLRKGTNQVSSEEAEEEVDGLTSKLRDLVTSELRSVWDRLGQVEKSKMPRVPEFIEEEIPLPYTQDLLKARVVGDSKAPKIPLYDGMTDPYDHLDNFLYAMEGRGVNETTKCRMFSTTLKGPAMSWFKRLAL